MTTFTPGPWHVEHGRDEDGAETETLHICHPATVCENTAVGQVWNHAEANARLIAAAPELYAALEFAATIINPHFNGSHKAASEKAFAALAKARGEPAPPISRVDEYPTEEME